MTIADMAKSVLALDTVYILTHTKPDGDALGSSFALCEFLKNQGKTATVVLEEKLHESYDFLQGEYITAECAHETRDVIVLDCATPDRVGTALEVYERAGKKIVIDHHATNEGFGDEFLVMGGLSSTGEIVYKFIKAAGGEITQKVAFFLYTAIMSDTGGLRYSSTTPETLRAVGELMERDIDIAYICRMLFENNPVSKIKLKGMVYSTLHLEYEGKVAVVYVTKEMMENSGTVEESTEGFVNIPRSIEGVEVGVFLKERDGEVKISLRSNAYADVSLVAKAMGGGGHIHAGGCSYKGTLQEAETVILEHISKIL